VVGNRDDDRLFGCGAAPALREGDNVGHGSTVARALGPEEQSARARASVAAVRYPDCAAGAFRGQLRWTLQP
jgi:hypothetical protein